MQSIGKACLKNQGGFVAKLGFQYLDENGNRQTSKFGGDIDLGQTDCEDPGKLGVPNGSIIFVYVDVVGGENNLAGQGFTYQSGLSVNANYSISGTTLDNTLGLINVG